MAILKIQDIFDLPEERPDFVAKIVELGDETKAREYIEQYVITERIRRALLRFTKAIVESTGLLRVGGGRFVEGTFGSGKSHFMAFVGLILKNHPVIWEKDDPAIQEIKAHFGDELAKKRFLVVPVYLMDKEDALIAIYEAINEWLQLEGQSPVELSDAGKVIAAFERQVETYGDAAWQALFTRSKAVFTFDLYDEWRRDQPDKLAEELLACGLVVAESRIQRRQLYPEVSEGMVILTRELRDRGYDALVLLLDEFVLYLQQQDSLKRAKDIGMLNALVEDTERQRAIPVWAIVARQRDISELFLDVRGEYADIQELFLHLKDRFPERENARLEEIDLFPICEQRLLRKKPGKEKALAEAIDGFLADLSDEGRQALFGEYSESDFRRIYPFHPAILDTTVDITGLLSKERTALSILFDILDAHRDMEIGQLVPHARLFDFIFPAEGMAAVDDHPDLSKYRDFYRNRLLPEMQSIFDEPSELAKAEDVVKSVLLSQLTRRWQRRGGITPEDILYLNLATLRGVFPHPLPSIKEIEGLLRRLAERVTYVRFDEQTRLCAIQVARMDLGEVLRRVPVYEPDVANEFKELLERPDLFGLKLEEGNKFQQVKFKWRGTARVGNIYLRNVRQLKPYEVKFDEDFTLYVDYPYDEEGFGLDDDRDQIKKLQDRVEVGPVAFWLPVHLAPTDRELLETLARARKVDSARGTYFGEYGKADREELGRQLDGFLPQVESILIGKIGEAYLKGEAHCLDPSIAVDIEGKTIKEVLESVGIKVLNRRFPQHPVFKADVTPAALKTLLRDFILKGQVPRGQAKLEALISNLAEPLEIAEGDKATWRLELGRSKYLKQLRRIFEEVGERVSADHLRQEMRGEFGLANEVTDFLVKVLIFKEGYRAYKGKKLLSADRLVDQPLTGTEIEKGQVLTVAQWGQAKHVAYQLFGIKSDEVISLPAQDDLWAQLGEAFGPVSQGLEEGRHSLLEVVSKIGLEEKDCPYLQDLAKLETCIDELSKHIKTKDSYEGLRAFLRCVEKEVGVEAIGELVYARKLADVVSKFNLNDYSYVEKLPDGAQLAEEARQIFGQKWTSEELRLCIAQWNETARKRIEEALAEVTKPEEKEVVIVGEEGEEYAPVTRTYTFSEKRSELAKVFDEAKRKAEADLKDLPGEVPVSVTVEIRAKTA
jgi:hypothetical protein